MSVKNYFRLIIEEKNKGWDAQLWRCGLGLAGAGYSAGVQIRKKMYDLKWKRSRVLPLPVISIGNITWGGAGKTPLARYISQFYLDRGKIPMILSRGYGSDETREFKNQVPRAVLGVGKKRFQAAQTLLKSKQADVAILDDGFQHRQLGRDLDIVVINVLNPFGNGKLIPCGILREPVDGLKRADLIVFNDANLINRKECDQIRSDVRAIAPNAIFVEAQHEPQYFYWARSKSKVDLDRLRNRRVTTFSGVGTPRSFQLLLSRLGVKTARNFEFCDHHAFSKRELKEIHGIKESSRSDYIVTTEKDFFRNETMIADMLDPLVLKIALKVTSGEIALAERLERLVRSKNGV